MSATIHAIFENGVFRPTSPVNLPERCEVEFEPRAIETPSVVNRDSQPNWDELHAILSHRIETGIPDLAARHDEHQP